MGFNLVLVIWGEVLAKYISLSFAGTANLFLIVGVFVCSSILNDAYFTAGKNKKFLYVYAVIIAVQIFTVYQNWSQGSFGHDGHIYLTGEKAMSLLFILTFAVIFLVTAYKTIQDKREGK
jgi:magnesium-transporting ATPase (P-type)